MKIIAAELQQLVSVFSNRALQLSDLEFSAKPYSHTWSKKEIMGHLIDSAHNNLRRFISGQIEKNPHIIYDQDFWVNVNNYQAVKKEDIIALWKLMNERICFVMLSMPVENYTRECNIGEPTTLHSLEGLAVDYIKHLKHHLNQIFSESSLVNHT